MLDFVVVMFACDVWSSADELDDCVVMSSLLYIGAYDLVMHILSCSTCCITGEILIQRT